MKRLVLLVAAVLSPTLALADYGKSVLQPWLNASQEELVSKWGYPQSANDVVRIDEDTTVFSYRSYRGGFGGPAPCVVSFTIKYQRVIAWKYEGANCPRYKR